MRRVPTEEIAAAFTLGPGEFFNLRAEVPGRKLPLETSGHLRIIFAGIGSAFSTLSFQTNLIIVKGKACVFVDVGTLALQRLRQFGISSMDVGDLIVTHSHADHTGGVEEVALRWRYQKAIRAGKKPGAFRPRLHIPETYARILWDRTLSGGLRDNEADASGRGLSLADYFELVPPVVEAGWGRPAYRARFETGGPEDLDILLFRTMHVPDSAPSWRESIWSCGLVIDGRVLYTGDTRFDRAVVERFGAEAETIFHDCQSFQGGVHSSIHELATYPAEVRARMLLSHLDDGMAEVDPKKKGFLGFAEDGMACVYDFD